VAFVYYLICDLLIPTNVNVKHPALDDMIDIHIYFSSKIKNTNDKAPDNNQQENGVCSIDINTLNLSSTENKIAKVESIFFSSSYVV